jgi:hypothetical protein
MGVAKPPPLPTKGGFGHPLDTVGVAIRPDGGGLATPKVPRVVAEPPIGAQGGWLRPPTFFFFEKIFF